MMKSIMLVFFLSALSTAYAQNRWGLGFEIGTPSCISGRYVTTSGNYFDALLSWGLHHGAFAQGSYDFKLATLYTSKTAQIEFYSGPGLFLGSPSRARAMIGLSGNFGIDFLWQRRLDFMLEMSPKIGVLPETDLEFSSGLGFRFMF